MNEKNIIKNIKTICKGDNVYDKIMDLLNEERTGRFTCTPEIKSKNVSNLMILVMNAGKNHKLIPIISKYLEEFPEEIDLKNLKGWTALALASRNTDTMSHHKVVSILLKYGANVNIVNGNGWSPLMLAAKHIYDDSNIGIVKSLLNAGSDINIQNNKGRTVIMIAIDLVCTYELIKLLLQYKPDINIQDKNGITAFMRIMKKSPEQIFAIGRMLVGYGCDINLVDKNGNNTLMRYLEKAIIPNINVVKLLIDYGSNVNQENSMHSTPLMIAHHNKNCDEDIVELLLESGADIHKVNVYGNSVLYNIVAINDSRIVGTAKKILEKGADINFKNYYDETALGNILYSDDPCIEIVQLLLDYGADPNIPDKEGNNSLINLVSTSCDERIVDMLFESGIDVNHLNECGESALSCICQSCHFDNDIMIIKKLVQHGANVNIIDNSGLCPLMSLLKKSEKIKTNHMLELIDLFMENGQDLNIKDKYGRNILMFAAKKYANVSVIDKLLEYGLDTNCVDKNGKTILGLCDDNISSAKIVEYSCRDYIEHLQERIRFMENTLELHPDVAVKNLSTNFYRNLGLLC